MKETTKTRLKIVGIFSAIALTVFVILSVANRINRAGDVEARSDALGSTMHFVGLYVQQNEGKWPTSWNDLDGLADPEHPEGLPFDATLSKEWVTVDFDTSSQQILDKLPETFDAITPNGDIKDGYVDHVYSKLITALKQYDDLAPSENQNTP